MCPLHPTLQPKHNYVCLQCVTAAKVFLREKSFTNSITLFFKVHGLLQSNAHHYSLHEHTELIEQSHNIKLTEKILLISWSGYTSTHTHTHTHTEISL